MTDSVMPLVLILAATSIWMMFTTWRRYGSKNVIMTPYLIAAIFLTIIGWTGQIQAVYWGYTDRLFPAIVLFSGIAAFLAGFHKYRQCQRKAGEYFRQPLAAHGRRYYVFGANLLLFVLLLLGTLRFQGIPPIAHILREVVSGNADTEGLSEYSKEARVSLTSGHWTRDIAYRGQGIMGRVLRVGFPYLLCIGIGLFFRTKSKGWLFFSAVVGMLTFLYVGGDGTRSNLANALIMVFVYISIVKPLRYKHLAALFCVSLLLLVLTTVTSYKGLDYRVKYDSILSVLNIVMARLGANSYDDVAAIELIDQGQLSYHYGMLFLEQLVAPIPGVRLNPIPFDLRLYQLMYPFSESSVYATTTLLGLIYTDGGLLAVILVYFMMGKIVGKSHTGLYSGQKEVSAMAFRAIVVYFVGRSMTDGILFAAFSILLVYAVHRTFTFFGRHGVGRRAWSG